MILWIVRIAFSGISTRLPSLACSNFDMKNLSWWKWQNDVENNSRRMPFWWPKICFIMGKWKSSSIWDNHRFQTFDYINSARWPLISNDSRPKTPPRGPVHVIRRSLTANESVFNHFTGIDKLRQILLKPHPNCPTKVFPSQSSVIIFVDQQNPLFWNWLR